MPFRVQSPTVYEQTNYRSTGRLRSRSPTADERDTPIHHEVGWMKIDGADRTVFDVLANARRARIVRTLADAPERTLDFDRLVDHVARRTDEDGPLERDRIAIRLHHVDLPKLSDAGVLDYDADDGTVRILTAGTLDGWAAASDGLHSY